MEARHDVIVADLDLAELREGLGDRHRGGSVRCAVAREESREVDGHELVTVHRENVAVVLSKRSCKADRSPTPEALRLAGTHDLDTRVGEIVLEVRFLPGHAAHDHARDTRATQTTDLPGEQRLATDRHERLRPSRRGIPETFGLSAGEDDRLHQSLGQSRRLGRCPRTAARRPA